MSCTVDFKVSPRLNSILGCNSDKIVEGMVNEAALKTERIIKMPGYCPVGSKPGGLKGFGPSRGHLRDRHRVTGSGTHRQIVNDASYVKYVITGHRVLTTPRSRRWWFWYLKNELGGTYRRKTPGPKGYVRPNNYPRRAVTTLKSGGEMKNIEVKYLKQFLRR